MVCVHCRRVGGTPREREEAQPRRFVTCYTRWTTAVCPRQLPTATSDSNGTQRVVTVGLTWGEDLHVAQVPSPLDIQRLPNRNCYNEVKTKLRFFLASLFTHLVNSIPLHRVRT